MLSNPPVIETERLVLRLAEVYDAPEIVRYYTENREHLAGSRPRTGAEFYTEDFWRSQAHAALAEYRTEKSLRLFLFEKPAARRVVGNLNFVQFHRAAAHYCTLGYGLDQEREGRGLMREALQAAIRFVFHDMNIHRIQANYVPWNRRSGGLLRRLGFTVEGYARDYLYLDGQWQDHILTSLTNHDWRPDG